MRVAVLAGILIGVAGCEVGPDYRAPVVAGEKGFGTTRPATTRQTALSEAPMVEARWWRTLGDPVLNGLMERVVTSNLDVKIAQLRVREARAALAFANGGQYPQVNVGANYSHQRLSQTAAPYNAFDIPGFPWEYNQYQAGFDASWELDVFGGERRAVEAASADLAASDADRHNVLLTAMAEVARNYVDLRGYQRRAEIARGNLKSQQDTLEVTRDRRKQGVITELDVAQAAGQVARTQAEIPVLERRVAEATHRIALLLGQTPEALNAELAAQRPVPVPPPEIAMGVPAELLRRRPDIRRAERDLAAATARVGQATADLYPKFSLTGNFSMTSADTKDLFDWRSRSFGIGPSVTWPIFDAGRIKSAIDARDAQRGQAAARYERAVLDALRETHDAIVTFATEQRRHLALADAVVAAQTAADISQAQYKQGIVDFLNVLDAQRSLFESEDQLADSDRAVTTAMVALYKALGGGWEPYVPARPTTGPVEASAGGNLR